MSEGEGKVAKHWISIYEQEDDPASSKKKKKTLQKQTLRSRSFFLASSFPLNPLAPAPA